MDVMEKPASSFTIPAGDASPEVWASTLEQLNAVSLTGEMLAHGMHQSV